MLIVTDALVIRSSEYGENDRLLTLLSPEHGRMQVIAKGARKMVSKQMQCAQLFCYANYELYEKRGMYWLRSGNIQSSFYRLSENLEAMALAHYLCDVAGDLCGEEVGAESLLRLLLNCLYVLSEKDIPPSLVKAVFEFRSMAMSGFYPYSVDQCSICQKKMTGNADPQAVMYWDVSDGRMSCPACMARRPSEPESPEEIRYASRVFTLTPGAAAAYRYTMTAPTARMFSFQMHDEKDIQLFGEMAEAYLLEHLERSFDTLAFYKQITAPPDAVKKD